MNKQEFMYFVSAIKTYYPREQILPNEQAVALWYEQLRDIEYETAKAILNKWVATNKWSPTIADIREGYAESTISIEDWTCGWQSVMTAVRKYGSYHPKEAVESLTGITRKCVESIGFVNICMNEENRFKRDFKDLYETYSIRARQDAQISATIKQQILGVSKQLAIGDEHG